MLAGSRSSTESRPGKRPDLVGWMIAQDLPEVIADRDVAQGVENMAHDFFKPQPVKGGLFWLTSNILPLKHFL